MAREKKKPDELSRRQFITRAGAVVITGAVAGLAACTTSTREDEVIVAASGVIMHDPVKCLGCGVCGMMCSLYHEGEQGPALSRSGLVRDPFSYEFTYNVCQQCPSPSCYFACPFKDRARLIDEKTGARYVNEDECIGCGACVKACPFEPHRTKLHPEKKIAITCDLCRERKEGPICIEYCPGHALTYVTREKRGKEDV